MKITNFFFEEDTPNIPAPVRTSGTGLSRNAYGPVAKYFVVEFEIDNEKQILRDRVDSYGVQQEDIVMAIRCLATYLAFRLFKDYEIFQKLDT